MRLFECQNCGNAVHFDNFVCVNCGSAVGYIPERFEMSALEPEEGAFRALAAPGGLYLYCDNAAQGVCNWLVPADEPHRLCISCRHNRIVPDLSFPENRERWRKIELAKRYLFRSLLRWRLPVPDRTEDPAHGLVFDLKADETLADGTLVPVRTGHDEGVITLNIAEADDAERENRRAQMGESYRTLIGHFRHEIGHFYWDMLIRDAGGLDGFRAVFGDEREDYETALRRHYENGPPAGWQGSFISSYATAHPWEDFAETFAHYVHIVDAVETARAYGIVVRSSKPGLRLDAPVAFEPYEAGSIEDLVRAWVPLTVAINGVNRSMGQPDLYPFVLSAPVMAKLGYVHGLVHAAREAADVEAPALAAAG